VFFPHLLALFIKKKNRRSHNQVQLEEKKYPTKPANIDNQGYLAKVTNQIIEST